MELQSLIIAGPDIWVSRACSKEYPYSAARLTEIVDSFIKKASCVARNARESSSLGVEQSDEGI